MPAKSRTLSAVHNHKANLPAAADPPTLSEISNLCVRTMDRIRDHQSVHELVLALASLCEADENSRVDTSGVWRGLAVIMERLSADGDEVMSRLASMNSTVLDAHAATKGGAQ
jgi:hypothetical protein